MQTSCSNSKVGEKAISIPENTVKLHFLGIEGFHYWLWVAWNVFAHFSFDNNVQQEIQASQYEV